MMALPLLTLWILLLSIFAPVSYGAAAAAAAAAATTTGVTDTTTTRRPGDLGVQEEDHHENVRRDLQTNHPDPLETHIQHYKLLTSEQIRNKLVGWADRYPDFIRVFTSQDAFGLDRAGGPDDCPFEFDNKDGCLNYVAVMQDYKIHPPNSDSSKRLPEVLWSGELHGNERVGPTAVVEATDLLLRAAACESLPRSNAETASDEEMQDALQCRYDLNNFGIADGDRRWLARLVTTRRIVIVPTANALGYFRNTREEGSVDPNRDFPYDLRDSGLCMKTIAGRTLNELFRQHLFQLSLTFHGGMEVIGFEWGAPTYSGSLSPDHDAQTDIAQAYSRFGDGWDTSSPYSTGPMNDLVYPVRGGMEDWAYAGSWDPDRVLQCTPSTFGGYPEEKTLYEQGTLRAFNMLVETSDNKNPPENDLGSSFHLMSPHTIGSGHVSRNIRLSLMSANLVQPFVSIIMANEVEIADDLVPLTDRSKQSCRTTKAVHIPYRSRKMTVKWSVDGALTVDDTQLWVAKWSDVPADVLDCQVQPDFDKLSSIFTAATPIGDTSGITRFAAGPKPAPFAASFVIEDYDPNEELVVIAWAVVDQAWADQAMDNVAPQVPPQSHMVNARTNPNWFFDNGASIIQGRTHWFSTPLTVLIGDFQEPTGNDDEMEVETYELYNRLNTSISWTPKPTVIPSPDDDASTTTTTSPPPTTPEAPADTAFGKVAIVLACIAFVVGLVAGRTALKHAMRSTRRSRVREFIEDESAASPGLRQAQAAASSSFVDDDDDEAGVDGGVELGRFTDRASRNIV